MEFGSLAPNPDGKWIAYTSFLDGAIWRCRLDGSERLQLTPPAFSAGVPSWSPDSSSLALVGYKPGELANLFNRARRGREYGQDRARQLGSKLVGGRKISLVRASCLQDANR